MGHANVIDRERIDTDDATAHRIDGDLVVAHDHQAQIEGDRRQHPPFAGRDRVDGHDLRLDDVLEIADLLVEGVIVIDEPMPIVLNADVGLEAEGHRGPGVGLELGAVDEEVGLGDGPGRIDRVAQALRVVEGNLDLRLLFEVEQLGADALGHGRVAGLREGEAGGDGDAAALADLQGLHAALVAVAQGQRHALGELGAGVGVGEAGARGDDVGLDQRVAGRLQVQALEAVADDAADALHVVLAAVSKDDRGSLAAHGRQDSNTSSQRS